MSIRGIPNTSYYTTMMNKENQARSKGNKSDEVNNSIKKATVDTVEITKLSDSDKAELERRAALDKVSPKEALMAALATAPNNDDVERSKALAAKFVPIQNKILSGQKLTPEEKQFLQKHYPRYLSSARIDSVEISSEAYKLQEGLTKMSARSGKDNLGITKGNSENSYLIHFKDSAMVSRAISRGVITVNGEDIQLSEDVKNQLASVDKEAEAKREAAYEEYIMQHDMAVAKQQGDSLRKAFDEYLSMLLGLKYDKSSNHNYNGEVNWSQFEWKYYETTIDISMEKVPEIQNIQVSGIVLNNGVNL